VTTSEEIEERGRTAAAMHSTAQQLEDAEATLHRSARRSPDTATGERLDELGDAVTAEARRIDHRADRIDHREA
jgi:hypothetical protein